MKKVTERRDINPAYVVDVFQDGQSVQQIARGYGWTVAEVEQVVRVWLKKFTKGTRK